MELRDYIADVLCAADTARSYLLTLRESIGELSAMPAKFARMEEEPWHSRGVRRFLVKNFFVYYRIDDAAKTVYILNVIYARRDQLRALAER